MLTLFKRLFTPSKPPCEPCTEAPAPNAKPRRFNPLAVSVVPIEYRYNQPQELWETRDLGLPYGWVVSDELREFGDEDLTEDDIITLRSTRGYPNNRPILIVEPVRL